MEANYSNAFEYGSNNSSKVPSLFDVNFAKPQQSIGQASMEYQQHNTMDDYSGEKRYPIVEVMPPGPDDYNTKYTKLYCKLYRWPVSANFAGGYGFSLDKDTVGNRGHRIGVVTPNSPAEFGNINTNDYILEVNGVSVEFESAYQVQNLVSKGTDTVYMVLSRDSTSTGSSTWQSKENTIKNAVVRKCFLYRWPDYQGLGVGLDFSARGPVVDMLEEDSPADLAKMKYGDRVIEINGVNVENFTSCMHLDKVTEIMLINHSCVSFLAVDAESDAYFAQQYVNLSSSMEGVEVHECPKRTVGERIKCENGVNCRHIGKSSHDRIYSHISQPYGHSANNQFGNEKPHYEAQDGYSTRENIRQTEYSAHAHSHPDNVFSSSLDNTDYRYPSNGNTHNDNIEQHASHQNDYNYPGDNRRGSSYDRSAYLPMQDKNRRDSRNGISKGIKPLMPDMTGVPLATLNETEKPTNTNQELDDETFKCEVCSISMSAKYSKAAHLKSDKHKQNLTIFRGKRSLLNATDEPANKIQAMDMDDETFRCEVCSMSMSATYSKAAHLKSDKHKKNILDIRQTALKGLEGKGKLIAPKENTPKNIPMTPSGNQSNKDPVSEKKLAEYNAKKKVYDEWMKKKIIETKELKEANKRLIEAEQTRKTNKLDQGSKDEACCCELWPECKIPLECTRWHPEEECKKLPQCADMNCNYTHPRCKFADKCRRTNCFDNHSRFTNRSPPGLPLSQKSSLGPAPKLPTKPPMTLPTQSIKEPPGPAPANGLSKPPSLFSINTQPITERNRPISQLHTSPFGMQVQPPRPPFGMQGQPQRPPFGMEGQSQCPPFGMEGQPQRPPFGMQGRPQRPTFGMQGQPQRPTFGMQGQPQRPPSLFSIATRPDSHIIRRF